ncbi:histidinol-phosphate aminotransferase family protein [Treponema sp. OMZ 792]|uniref:pyridoxal phosphate-dependent aminotransferase n=1 Tax=unclassified Treponema TaxID=2638727 RepID=UPI0020A4E377|nr:MULTISPECIES: histidinol-phosphate transaminase [unclassified Treponema]UTC74615.1 histidinol-phosphate aminotransferase family protein [Treponema sp. OMZ 792]UTC77108.1 histidinol-phosphate aminotransferase family protein [Treponema sp. OMZ 799]UTC81012.1 histidinol-phosphate aminotransferase family protein [Treponema sp. OMZ 798]
MEHGGVLSYKKRDEVLIDFSSNINPLMAPKGLKKALSASFDNLLVYPDIRYRSLKKITAKYLKCGCENIVLGNGAVEIIDNFCFLFKRVIVFTPSFSEYGLRALVHKKPLVEIPFLSDFSIDIAGLEKNLRAGDLLILGNPNNPTGLRIEKNRLLQIYNLVQKTGAFLLLDEAFYEFCPPDYDSINLFKKAGYKNICIIRAATKFFALPGIRLGYACTSPETVSALSKIEIVWHINAFAEAAAPAIFFDEDFIKKSKAYIQKERTFLLENIEKYGTSGAIKLQAYKSHCNFILLKVLNAKDEDALKFFEKKEILVRTCTSFKSLGDNHIRIAVRSHKDNCKFIKAISSKRSK